jgi:hypothetical protein
MGSDRFLEVHTHRRREDAPRRLIDQLVEGRAPVRDEPMGLVGGRSTFS